MKLGDFIKRKWNYIVVFLMPWIIVVIHSFVRSSWLTGQGSLLNGDTGIQLYPMMAELWDKVHSGDSLFYSWNAGMGYDFYLNMSYYLISPFNLIILLFPKAWIADTVQFVMVLKWSLMGLSATYYFMHTKNNMLQNERKLVSLILGLGYVLSNAMLVFFGYFNWGDVLIIFPILVLLLEQLMESGKWKVYYIILTVAMICNFYMAYQVCIFLVLWFLLQWDASSEHRWKRFGTFAASSVLSAITSMVLILPGVLGVSNRYGSESVTDKIVSVSTTWINDIYDLGEKLFIFNDGIVNWHSYQPNLFFSTGLLVLCLLVFFVKLRPVYKVKLGLIWLFMTISLCSGALLVFWHGFSIPNGVYHRYLYIYIFVMLYMGLEVIQQLDSLKIFHVAVMGIVEISLFVLSFLHVEQLQDFYDYLITFMLVVLYNVILILFVRKSLTVKQVIVFFSVMVSFELVSNAFYEFKEYNIVTWEENMKNGEVSSLVENIKLDKGERIDLLQCESDIGMYEGLPNTSIFASYCNGAMIRMYEKFGMEFSLNAGYTASGTSPLLNLLFNIRYGTSDSPGSFSDVELVGTKDGVNLYQMNRLAGLGYMVNSKVLEWDIEKLNNFDNQNAFVNYSTDVDDIFTVVKPKVTFGDPSLNYNYDKTYMENGYYYYEYTSTSVADMEMTAFSFTVDEDMDLYLDMFGTKTMWNMIFVDEKLVHKDNALFYQTGYHFGPLKKGQEVTLYSMHSMNVGEKASLWFRLAKFNEENYAKAYEKLSKNTYQIDEMKSTYVSGTIHADEDGIMMTSIPAMDGFQVYVDGEETPFESVGGALIGVPLRAGDHKVEFKYMTPYFIPGLIGSVAGILIFVIICIVDAARKKAPLFDDKTEEIQGEA